MFHVIKRFANGRFWSMDSKDYIAPETIKTLSQTENIFILCNKTKKDVTIEVLDQIETKKIGVH